jgi:hypothetical protein
MSAIPDAEPTDAELDHYGIQRVPADTFVWQRYRYTEARDALAAVKRVDKR